MNTDWRICSRGEMARKKKGSKKTKKKKTRKRKKISGVSGKSPQISKILSLVKEIENQIDKGETEEARESYENLLKNYKKMKSGMSLDDYVSLYKTVTGLKNKMSEARKTGESKRKKIKKVKNILSVPKKLKRLKPSMTASKKDKYQVETEIDRLYEMVRDRGMIKVRFASKKLNVKRERIEEWGRILEDHDLIILHYPPFGDPFLMLKKFKHRPKIKEGKKKKKSRKPIVINLIIIIAFAVFILYYTGRIPQNITDLLNLDFLASMDIGHIQGMVSGNEIYLAGFAILLIAAIIAVKVIRSRKTGKNISKKPKRSGVSKKKEAKKKKTGKKPRKTKSKKHSKKRKTKSRKKSSKRSSKKRGKK